MMWFCWLKPLQGGFQLSVTWPGSSSKFEAMFLNWKKVECSLWVGDKALPQAEGFMYLGILFTSDCRLEREMNRRIGASSAVMMALLWSVGVKRESCWRAKLSIYWSIFVPTLTCGHKIWERSQLRWFGHLVRNPPDRLSLEISRARLTGRRLQSRSRTCGRDYVSLLAWRELESVTGEVCLRFSPEPVASNKWKTMDGWKDLWQIASSK